jgi:predicted site-specific integrase-resolvase
MNQKTQAVEDELISTREAAMLAGVSQKTVARWFDRGLVVGDVVPMGKRSMRRVSRKSLMACLAVLNHENDQADA